MDAYPVKQADLFSRLPPEWPADLLPVIQARVSESGRKVVVLDSDAWLVIPFFIEGGRFTIDDIHYVAEGEWLTPAGQTEFARDRTFGYQASNLRHWVAEKSGGAIPAARLRLFPSPGCVQKGRTALPASCLTCPGAQSALLTRPATAIWRYWSPGC